MNPRRKKPPAGSTVRAQYEALPYPARNPEDERTRLITGSPSHLDEINHYVFGGRLDFSKPFRALVAGGGTGDVAIMLAQQMADRKMPGEVVYLDLSSASRAVAETRAKVRGLTNITFHQGSLLEAASVTPGPFDYIDCCGVLHHLDDPGAGLRALASELREGGGMGLMVYGALGRTGVYPAQEALRALAAGEPVEPSLALARTLLDDLPATNWLKRNDNISSLVAGDDAALYDLLLHSRDRAYTVLEVAGLCVEAGLTVTAFVEPARYDPLSYLRDADLCERAARLGWIEACALAENVAGNLKTHAFYVTKGGTRDKAVARVKGAAVPVLLAGDGPWLARKLAPEVSIRAEFGGLKFSFDIAPGSAACLRHVNGASSLREIFRTRAGTQPWPAFLKDFEALYRGLNGVNAMVLRFDPPPKKA